MVPNPVILSGRICTSCNTAIAALGVLRLDNLEEPIPSQARFESRVVLQDFLTPKVREPSLPCYLTHNWWEKRQVGAFRHWCESERNRLAQILNSVERFNFQSRYPLHYLHVPRPADIRNVLGWISKKKLEILAVWKKSSGIAWNLPFQKLPSETRIKKRLVELKQILNHRIALKK